MSFPDSVAVEALTSCGRCCCICHKFCGTKIELHHIEQKAYGGEDSLENCIPLCFDCHSDMGKADPKHPKGKRYSIEELMKACSHYFDMTGRRITFEYSLVSGVNDTDEDAGELIALARPLCCHVNLIPVNPIKERSYRHSAMDHIVKFKNILENNRINVTIRREMGADINAACGQLRKSYMDKKETE